MSLKTWAGFRSIGDNAHGVIRPTGRSGCRRGPRVRLNPWRTGHRAGVQLADSACTSPNIACRRSRAGIAQGAQFVEADAGEDFHAAQRIGAAGPAPARWHGRPGAGANGGSAVLDGMQGRGAAWTSPSPSWRSSWAKRSCMSGTKRRNTWTISSRLPPKRPTISPRASTSSPASAAVAGAPWRRSCRDDRAGKAPGAPCRSASPHGHRSCPPPGRLRGRPARRWRSWRDRQPGEAPVGADSPGRPSRPSISGICMSISTASNGTLASSTAERPPARRRRGPPGALCSTARRRPGGSARCPPLPADARPATRWVGSTRRGGGLAGAPLFAVQRMQHRVGQLLGRDRLGGKSTKGGAVVRAHRPAPRGHRR